MRGWGYPAPRSSRWRRHGPRNARSVVQLTSPSLEESQVQKRSIRVASLSAVAALLFAACSSGGGAATTAPSAAAPSASSSEAAPSGSASAAAGDPKTATSAAAAGGVDAVCAAGKEEGQVTLIATPANWANYGQMITDFQTKYGIKVQSDQPDADSAGRDQGREGPRGHRPPAGHLRPRQRRRRGEHRHVRPVPGRDVGRHSRCEQGADRPLGQQLHGLRVDRL